jgi:ankyrin repeat protein
MEEHPSTFKEVINAQDEDGSTALHLAAAFGFIDLCVMLMQASLGWFHYQGRLAFTHPFLKLLNLFRAFTCVAILKNSKRGRKRQ